MTSWLYVDSLMRLFRVLYGDSFQINNIELINFLVCLKRGDDISPDSF
jgi:hypothetical protein